MRIFTLAIIASIGFSPLAAGFFPLAAGFFPLAARAETDESWLDRFVFWEDSARQENTQTGKKKSAAREAARERRRPLQQPAGMRVDDYDDYNAIAPGAGPSGKAERTLTDPRFARATDRPVYVAEALTPSAPVSTPMAASAAARAQRMLEQWREGSGGQASGSAAANAPQGARTEERFRIAIPARPQSDLSLPQKSETVKQPDNNARRPAAQVPVTSAEVQEAVKAQPAAGGNPPYIAPEPQKATQAATGIASVTAISTAAEAKPMAAQQPAEAASPPSPPAASPPATASIQPATVDDSSAGNAKPGGQEARELARIPFSPEQGSLSPENKKVLDDVAEWLKSNPGQAVVVQGMAGAGQGGTADARGSALKNALAVRGMLAERGADPSRVKLRALAGDPGGGNLVVISGGTAP